MWSDVVISHTDRILHLSLVAALGKGQSFYWNYWNVSSTSPLVLFGWKCFIVVAGS